MNNNFSLYKETIVKVIDVKEEKTEIKNQLKNIYEQQYKQEVTVKVLNGEYKGEIFTFENDTDDSNVYSDRYKENMELFVTLENNNIKKIDGIRRDKYIIPIVILFIGLLLIIGKQKGLFSFIGLIFNILIVILTLFLRDIGLDAFYVYIGASILFTFISLILTSGINKKTLISIISTLSTLLISFIISFIVIKIFEHQIPYWHMDYVEVLFDYEKIFLVSILIGGLGAIMDIAITISSTLNELVVNNKNITKQELKKSGMEVSKDVMGTMVNVLFFSYISGSIPMVLFVMRNGIPLALSVINYSRIEIIRFLSSSIGLVLAIPISLFFTLKLIKRGDKK